jgi:polyisoprenoid-binding protein YceI
MHTPIRTVALAVLALGAWVGTGLPAPAATAAKLGAACKSNALGQTARVGGKTLVCARSGSRTVWKAAPAAAKAASSIDGTWTAGVGSVAGYRVRELFAGRPAKNEAVGRTDAVTGSVTIARVGTGLVARAVTVTVDLTGLTSNERRRDDALKDRGLETDTFPTATFVSSGDVALPADAATGAVVSVTVNGKLTLHGVTRELGVPVQARMANGAIEVVGQAPIVMADFGIDPPSTAGVVTVDGDGVFEFKLVLGK